MPRKLLNVTKLKQKLRIVGVANMAHEALQLTQAHLPSGAGLRRVVHLRNILLVGQHSISHRVERPQYPNLISQDVEVLLSRVTDRDLSCIPE